MTRETGAAAGAVVGGICGLALYALLSTHTAHDALTIFAPCLLVYALVGAALGDSRRSRRTASARPALPMSSAACPAVLPGVPVTRHQPMPVVVPRPRTVSAAR